MRHFYNTVVVTLLVISCTTAVQGIIVPISKCEPGDIDCVTLGDALMGLDSDTTLELASGVHYVSNFTLITGLHNVSFIGEDDATIACAEGVGLAFVNVSDLSFERVAIDGCGLTGRNLDKTVTSLIQFVRIFIQIPSDVTVGVFIGHCSNLRMENVTVANTSGIGLVGINVLGKSLLWQVDFLLNIRPSDCNSLPETYTPIDITQSIGGGAYFLYTDSLSLDHYQPTLRIQESKFIENSECSVMGILERNYLDSQFVDDVGYIIGGGGGLTIMLAQAEYGVEIASDSSLFQNNTAREGAGVHIGIFTGVRDSHVVFSDCTFLRNGFSNEELAIFAISAFTAGGAGISIANDLIRPNGYEAPLFTPNRNVSVDLHNCNFSENGALVGGGLAIFSTHISAVGDLSDVSIFRLSGCSFRNNSAFIGAALSVFEFKLSGRFLGIQVQATNLTVMHNRGIVTVAGSRFENPSAIDLHFVNFTLRGDSHISFNKATGLQNTNGVLGVVGNVTFESNVGVRGGALNLFSFSYLIVTGDSKVHFIKNIGNDQGGAIFVTVGSLGGNQVDDCFLFFGYEDFNFCNNCSNLNNFGVSIEFVGNFAPSGGIIYGSGLEFCPWAQPLKKKYPNTSVVDILHTHYPNVFSFDRGPRGVENIMTTPKELVAENLQPSYSVIPGEELYITVSALDALRQNVPAVLSSYSIDSLTDQPGFLRNVTPRVGPSGYEFLNGSNHTSVSLSLQATENQSVSIILYTVHSEGRARIQVNIDVGECPDGFLFNNNTHKCECIRKSGITCDISNGTILVSNGEWIGRMSDGGELLVHQCAPFYCKLGTKTITTNNETTNFDSQCAVGSNRGGILCGSCREGFSVTIGGRRCLNCSNTFLSLLVVYLLLGILLVVMITFFQITITEGVLNGVLFYSNIVILYAPYIAPSGADKGLLILPAIFSLHLGVETCFYDGMTPLQKVWWQLSFPLYLFFLMIGIALLARCCKWKQITGVSVIQAFGTLCLLCYIEILDYSLEILTAERITTLSGNRFLRWGVDPSVQYFRGVHGFLAVVGCLLIPLYIIPLPLFLMFPTLAYRAPWLKKFKPYYDSFWNPFKPKYRFWLGFRLLFRWVPFALVYYIPPPKSFFISGILLALLFFFQMVVQPFRKEWINILDSFFLINLVALFMGALYFRARENADSNTNRDQASAFSTALVNISYPGYGIMVLYHIGKRFPRLKEWFSKCFTSRNKGPKKVEKVFVQNRESTPPAERNADVDGDSVIAYGAAANYRVRQHAATFSQLREPCMEQSGTIEIVAIPFSIN